MNRTGVCRDLEIMGGTPLRHARARGDAARLSGGRGIIGDFLEGFPSITREQVVAFLDCCQTYRV
jgi:hypothetical protein